MEIFQKSVINKHLASLDKEQVERIYQKFKENYSPAKIEKIKQLQDKINTTEKEIDQMVYKLYELSEEEIRIMEKGVD